MCGRFSLRDPRGHAWLADIPSELAQRRYNVAPSQRVLAIGRDREGVRRVRSAVWGFRPRWLAERRRAPINARAETVATTPMFRNALRQGRCLVPADGWYEWQSQESGPNVPYFFHRPDDSLFWFAGLAATSAESVRTVALLTTDANETASAVHARMPLILRDDEAASAWIEADAEQGDLERLLLPPPDEAIAAYPVSRRVNKPENDDAGCVARKES